MHHCHHCGAALSEDARFCGACGTPRQTDSAASPRKPFRRWVVVLVALVPLAFAVAQDIGDITSVQTPAGHRDNMLMNLVCGAISAGMLLLGAIIQKWKPVLRNVLVGVVVLMIAAFVVGKANWKVPPYSSGHTEADQSMAAAAADYLLQSGNAEHVTSLQATDGELVVYTDLDGSMPNVLESTKAIDICKAAKAGAPNNSGVTVLNAGVPPLPLFSC